MLRIFQTVDKVTTPGPYTRFGLWVQGCARNCPGCVSPEAQTFDGGYAKSVRELAEEILCIPDIEGITISGGEPFLQEAALCRLLAYVKERRDFGVILYTGYTFAEISSYALTRLCDSVIDGAYIRELDDGMSLRGSSNQRLVFVTDRYQDSLHIGEFGRKMELLETGAGGLSMVGVPSAHSIRFSEDLKKFLATGR